jgi:PAS domain S-box-containing protein
MLMRRDLLKQDTNRLAYLIEYNPNTIIITTPNGAIEYVNSVFTSVTGYTAEEVVGHHIDELKLDDLSSTTTPYSWADIMDGYVWEGELISRKKDGSQFPEHVFVLPITDGFDTVTSVCFVKRDITESKKAERDLLSLTDTLEERVKTRTSQLDASNRELLNTLDQIQDIHHHLVESEKMASLGGLIAGVAHEINTPVGIAFTAATHLEKTTRTMQHLFESGTMKRSDLALFMETCTESSRLLHSNLNRASELIRSFKQVAVDQTGEGRRVFKFREYIAEILLSLRPVLKKTNHVVAVSGDSDLYLNSYPGAFSQIITNLITNSLTHAFKNRDAGRMEISFEKNDTHFILVFADDGQGISREDKEDIFSPFFTTNRESGGSGLGLHIIFNLITQRLHGTIDCTSREGVGTTFTITIPNEVVSPETGTKG